LVSRNHAQFYRRLTCEGAVNVVDAVADDVIIGDNVRVFTHDETGAGNLGQSFRFRRGSGASFAFADILAGADFPVELEKSPAAATPLVFIRSTQVSIDGTTLPAAARSN